MMLSTEAAMAAKEEISIRVWHRWQAENQELTKGENSSHFAMCVSGELP